MDNAARTIPSSAGAAHTRPHAGNCGEPFFADVASARCALVIDAGIEALHGRPGQLDFAASVFERTRRCVAVLLDHPRVDEQLIVFQLHPVGVIDRSLQFESQTSEYGWARPFGA
jgi:hypothetical protein